MVALGERAAPNGQELLAEFIQYGHQKPFEEIVRRYAGMVFNVCFRITKDKHEAEDAVQAVFLTLALQAKRGADIKALGPWLQQVAKRLALDIRRSKKRRKTREERHHVEQTIRRESILGDTLPSADLDELKTILNEELQKLPAKYRLPLILHYFGGLSRDEMAAELNCKPSTLGVRIFRGREMLAGRLSGRGIHISTAMLAMMLGYAVKQAVSDTLIASTSHAATAMMAGHDGAGMASAHVIGLTRRASSAMVIGKVKLTALTLLLTATSLGAGAKALKMLPAVDVQQILQNQFQRLLRPLIQPFNRPILSQIAPVATSAPKPAVTVTESFSVAVPTSPVIAETVVVASRSTAPATVAVANETTVQSAAPSVINIASLNKFHPSASGSTTLSDDRTTASAANTISASDSPESSASSSAGGGGIIGSASLAYVSDPLPPQSAYVSAAQLRTADVAISSNNLVVGSPLTKSSSKTSSTTVTPQAIVLLPSIGGTVTETGGGMVRGWGKIDLTGTLQMNGQVVADGKGIDRTLNLTAFSMLQTASSYVTSPSQTTGSVSGTPAETTSATSTCASGSTQAALAAILPQNSHAGVASNTWVASKTSLPTNGWYAVNHGQLCLGLEASSSSPSMLTWGDDPNSATLSLTNSVRLALNAGRTSVTDSDDAGTRELPRELSMLSPDRLDAPHLSQISGATIGLWRVDPAAGEISASLSISYDSLLANALGATQNSIELWTLSDPSGVWEEVNPSSFALDTTDHLVYGSANDFSYFAVSATPAPGENVELVRAQQLTVINSGEIAVDSQFGGSDANANPLIGIVPSSNIQAVPEPTGLIALTGSLALLRRRRRGTVSTVN